jgi:hypothetical protein
VVVDGTGRLRAVCIEGEAIDLAHA